MTMKLSLVLAALLPSASALALQRTDRRTFGIGFGSAAAGFGASPALAKGKSKKVVVVGRFAPCARH